MKYILLKTSPLIVSLLFLVFVSICKYLRGIDSEIVWVMRIFEFLFYATVMMPFVWLIFWKLDFGWVNFLPYLMSGLLFIVMHLYPGEKEHHLGLNKLAILWLPPYIVLDQLLNQIQSPYQRADFPNQLKAFQSNLGMGKEIKSASQLPKHMTLTSIPNFGFIFNHNVYMGKNYFIRADLKQKVLSFEYNGPEEFRNKNEPPEASHQLTDGETEELTSILEAIWKAEDPFNTSEPSQKDDFIFLTIRDGEDYRYLETNNKNLEGQAETLRDFLFKRMPKI